MRRTHTRSALVAAGIGSLAMGAALLAQGEDQSQQNAQEQLTPQQTQQLEQQAQQLPPGQFPAVLKSREVSFTYRSTNSVLACDELRNRVATILRELGARDDVQVSVNECDTFVSDSRAPRRSDPSVSGTFQPGGGGDYSGRGDDMMKSPIDRQMERRQTLTHGDQFDRYKAQTSPVRIQMMVPVVITPEILAEVERDKSRRELVSRVQGNPAAAMNDPIFFAAERRPVNLSHETIELEPLDCELLEQMSRTVFRQLDMKVKSSSLSCDSRSFKPKLTVEALLPVGYLMPGEQRAKKREDEAAAKKASGSSGQ